MECLLQLEPSERLGEQQLCVCAGGGTMSVCAVTSVSGCSAGQAELWRMRLDSYKTLLADIHTCLCKQARTAVCVIEAHLCLSGAVAVAVTGYKSLQEVQQHPFFAGINWQAVRAAPAPQFVPRPAQDREDLSLDWELTSLFRQPAAPALKYEYLPTGATV